MLTWHVVMGDYQVEFMERVVALQGEALRQRLSVVFLGEMEGADPPEEEGGASDDVAVGTDKSPFFLAFFVLLERVVCMFPSRGIRVNGFGNHCFKHRGFRLEGLGFRRVRGSSLCDQASSSILWIR